MPPTAGVAQWCRLSWESRKRERRLHLILPKLDAQGLVRSRRIMRPGSRGATRRRRSLGCGPSPWAGGGPRACDIAGAVSR